LQKLEPEELERLECGLELELLKRDCQNSLYSFLRTFWKYFDESQFVDNWHIKYLCDLAQDIIMRAIRGEPKDKDLIVNVSPGTTKSGIFSVMLPAWSWTVAPWFRWITGSFEMGLATFMATKSRDIIRSDLYQLLFGDVFHVKPDQDNKTEYHTNKTGARKVCSTGGSIVGFHGHALLIDDPLNPKDVLGASENMKKTVNNWFDGVLPTRKVHKRTTPTILVMQRLATDDPTGHLLEKKRDEIMHICLPGELTELDNVKPPELKKHYQGNLFDPVRLGRPELAELKTDLRAKGYAGQILQHPRAIEGTIFKRAWWRYFDVLPSGPPIRKVQSWDTAFKKGKENAKNAMIYFYQYQTGFYITKVFSEHLEFPQLDEQIRMEYNADPCHALLIEDKASGISLIQTYQQTTTMPVIPVNPCGDKEARANASTPNLEAGNVYLPRGAPWAAEFVEIFAGFPDIEYKDLIDCFSQFFQWITDKPSGVPQIKSRRTRNVTLEGW